jgi:hypothetical protein
MFLTLALTGVPYAGEPTPASVKRVITPYGDFCTKCSIYGIGRRPVKVREAVSAAEAYFKKKGLTVGKVRGRRRFIVMDVYRGDVLVDRVVFDRRTGRLRSIY